MEEQDDEDKDKDSGENDNSDAQSEEMEDEADIFNDPDFQNMSDSDGDNLPLFENLSADELSGDEEGTYRAKEKRAIKSKVTEVDDQFFKLRDMEQFLEMEDRREERRQNENDVDCDDDDFIDYFGDIGENSEEAGAMYSQYFREDDATGVGGSIGDGEGEMDSEELLDGDASGPSKVQCRESIQ